MGMNDNKTGHETSDGSIGAFTNRDTNRGHPEGDVVDNSQAANPSKDPSKVYHVGSNLRSMAAAPHLLGIIDRN